MTIICLFDAYQSLNQPQNTHILFPQYSQILHHRVLKYFSITNPPIQSIFNPMQCGVTSID